MLLLRITNPRKGNRQQEKHSFLPQRMFRNSLYPKINPSQANIELIFLKFRTILKSSYEDKQAITMGKQ